MPDNQLSFTDKPGFCAYDPEEGLYCQVITSSDDFDSFLDAADEVMNDVGVSERDLSIIYTRQSQKAEGQQLAGFR